MFQPTNEFCVARAGQEARKTGPVAVMDDGHGVKKGGRMGIYVGVGMVVAFVLLIVAPCLTWGGIERSLDTDQSDRDRTRECRQMARRLSDSYLHEKV